MTAPDWDALAARVAAGDDSGFDTLYLALFGPLVEFGYQYVRDVTAAEDIVQDVFQSYWRARRERAVRGVRIYLYSAVKKRALNYRRHERVVARVASESDGRSMAPGYGEPPRDPAAEVDGAALREALDRVLDELPPQRREVVLLRWKHGLGYAEIAELLEISVAAAQAQVSRVQRAVRPMLRRFLEDL